MLWTITCMHSVTAAHFLISKLNQQTIKALVTILNVFHKFLILFALNWKQLGSNSIFFPIDCEHSLRKCILTHKRNRSRHKYYEFFLLIIFLTTSTYTCFSTIGQFFNITVISNDAKNTCLCFVVEFGQNYSFSFYLSKTEWNSLLW